MKDKNFLIPCKIIEIGEGDFTIQLEDGSTFLVSVDPKDEQRKEELKLNTMLDLPCIEV